MKKVFVLAICVFTFCFLSIPSLAEDYTPVTDYFYGDSAWTNNTYPLMYAELSCDSSTYIFRSVLGNDCIHAISTVQNSVVSCSSWINWDGGVKPGFSIVCDTPIGDYWIGHGADGAGLEVLYGGVTTNYFTGGMSGFDVVDTNKLIADFSAYLGELPSPVSSTYSIPAGYVAYISASSGSTFSLVHNFGFNSRAFSDQWGDGSSLQAYKTGVSSLPSASTSFPLPGMTDISYVRDQNRNLLGQSRVGLSSITSGASGYTVVYNPLYRSDYKNYNEQVSSEEYYYNSTIYLSSPSISFFRLYPLSEAYTSLTTIEGSSISGYEDYTDVSVDPDTGEVVYTNQDGDVSLSPPAFGGTNQTPEPVGTANWLQQITSLLSNVVQSLGTIFGFAYEAIVTLVGAASAFVVTLGSLYAWLPAPLSSVLISAITVAITIGVFKAFL